MKKPALKSSRAPVQLTKETVKALTLKSGIRAGETITLGPVCHFQK
jgi:hypothetical protein